MIGIVDCDLGNLRSVENAVLSLGFDAQIVRHPDEITSLTHVILPGVGAFGPAALRLHERGFVQPLRAFACAGRPVLGICLGMQLLATEGDEGIGSCRGLDLVSGLVRRLPDGDVPAIPHVGWNSVVMRATHPVFARVRAGADFYFVHSYHFQPADAAHGLGATDYGIEMTSVVARDNVLGFQFHPEKSQANGIRLLENFCGWDGRC